MSHTAPAPATPTTLPYRYFVSFSTPHGFGNTVIALRLPVRGIEDVHVITDNLNEAIGRDGVVVLYFTALPTA